MTETAIQIDNLSKRYLVGHRAGGRERYTTLRDGIAREASNFTRKARDAFRGRQIVQGDEIEEFWALKDVSFEVGLGEAVGIIGRNGAGKSTLLKILSRITEPTVGRVGLRGRVASLLEVGTGFHPELTGRENIFLNGAILGMTRREIRNKFDEIVAFAGVEKFLDTPVKHYSSGMYVRLAFAVAAHLDPEILVVDEVLAVGDAEFQARCLGKMRDVASRQGRTVLFVSHNMGAVAQLTSRSVVLSQGRIDFIGPSPEAIAHYLHGQGKREAVEYDVRSAKRQWEGTGEARIMSLRFDRPAAVFAFGKPLEFLIRVRTEQPIGRIRISMTVFAADGAVIGSAFGPELDGMAAGEEREFAARLPLGGLVAGSYFCAVAIGRGTEHSSPVEYDVVNDTLFFEVTPKQTEMGATVKWDPGWGRLSFPDFSVVAV
ncbi:MAG TPA: ABC transporter ATP-binding protein [Xanthobacteraceae bacterium]